MLMLESTAASAKETHFHQKQLGSGGDQVFFNFYCSLGIRWWLFPTFFPEGMNVERKDTEWTHILTLLSTLSTDDSPKLKLNFISFGLCYGRKLWI